MFRWHFKFGYLLTVWGNLEGIPGNPGEIPHIESKSVGSKGLISDHYVCEGIFNSGNNAHFLNGRSILALTKITNELLCSLPKYFISCDLIILRHRAHLPWSEGTLRWQSVMHV